MGGRRPAAPPDRPRRAPGRAGSEPRPRRMPAAPEFTRGGTMDGDPERSPRRRSGPERRESDCPPPGAALRLPRRRCASPDPRRRSRPRRVPVPAGRRPGPASSGAWRHFVISPRRSGSGRRRTLWISRFLSPPLPARMSDRRGAPLPFRIRRTPPMRNGAFLPARPAFGRWNVPTPVPAPFREASRAATPARAPRKAAASTVRGAGKLESPRFGGHPIVVRRRRRDGRRTRRLRVGAPASGGGRLSLGVRAGRADRASGPPGSCPPPRTPPIPPA